MKRVLIGLAAFCLHVALYGGSSDEASRETMVRDLGSVRNVYSVEYAFGDWKKERFGWDLEAAYQEAVAGVYSMEPVSTQLYHRRVHDFITSMKDYHVNVIFNCTERASLPFAVSPAGGRYFVVWVDQGCPFKVGDELIRFDGRPIGEVIEELILQEDHATPATDQALAALFLTQRTARFAQSVPQGKVTVTVKPKKGREQSFDLLWDYHPEEVPLDPHQCACFAQSMRMGQTGSKAEPKSAFRCFINDFHQMTLPLYQSMVKEGTLGNRHHDLGDREGPLPPLGRVAWKTDESDPFYAYIFHGPKGKKVGYLRIPHYGFYDDDLEYLADILNRFERETDQLVLDQLNNPGGDGFLASAMASMFCQEPVALPLLQWKLNPRLVHGAVEAVKELDELLEYGDFEDWVFYGYSVDAALVQCLRDHMQFLVDEWRAGKRETDPFYFLGIKEMGPHPWAQYSKPILLLTNELDFSCGDIFPAMLQDMGRARILGSCTAGAGGAVSRVRFPNHFGIDFTTVTVNRIIRQNGQMIENIGVQPDRPLPLTVNDLQNGYTDYVKAIFTELERLR